MTDSLSLNLSIFNANPTGSLAARVSWHLNFYRRISSLSRCTTVDKISLNPDCVGMHYFEWLASCQNGVTLAVNACVMIGFSIARALGTWHEPRRPSMMGPHSRRVESPHVGGPKLVPVANWHNNGYRAAPIARPERSSSCVRAASIAR